MAIAMKAMGIESEQEIIQYIGPEPALLPVLLPTLQECKQIGIFSQQQALQYIGTEPPPRSFFQLRMLQLT